ncbi:DJ-1/PfpI family protein [Paenibacillus sp. N3.4]|uniref:DJ-1/PfpI family protein n=1 Tax=Paenibacillus sp. N3.4 TaxID=2603222 RepID=UPI0011C77DA0|nr:DJ-1/PfpI family protein [Paenibacillus sp. N3.4]TXK84832.1 DJ-1/PfpI family protein [Paenibacillus sp. N3.4]
MHIQIVLFDGFDLLDALAPYEVFCAAEMYAGGAWSVELVTTEGARLVASGMNGPQVSASGRLSSERSGIILVPGASGEVSGDGPNAIPSILRRAMESEITSLIKEAFGKPDVIIATVCGGSLVLAMGGLLEGRHTVTNHLGMEVLGATGAIPVTARVVDDGNLVTGGGVTSGLDVALYLVERELGPRIAHAVEKLFEYERRGTVWKKQGLAPLADDSHFITNEESTTSKPSDEWFQKATDPSISSIFDGTWHAIISTPIGKLPVMLHISTANGQVSGVSKQGDELVAFVDPIIEGNRLSWSQRVTKPMRLNLRFEVNLNGNKLTGIAKAGLLPASKVAAERVAEASI